MIFLRTNLKPHFITIFFNYNFLFTYIYYMKNIKHRNYINFTLKNDKEILFQLKPTADEFSTYQIDTSTQPDFITKIIF
jgi:hypothetical protein